jgi:hypothetical protein
MWTLCNYDDDDELRVRNLFEAVDPKSGKEWVERGIVGREVAPTTGMPHVQGFFRLCRRAMRKKVVKMLRGRAWAACMKGTEAQAWNYCRKDGNILVKKGDTCECMHDDARRMACQQRRADDARTKREMQAREVIRDCKVMSPEEFAAAHPVDWLVRRAAVERLMLDYRASQAHKWDRDLWEKNVWLWGVTGTGKSVWASLQEEQQFTYRKNVNKWWDGFVPGLHKLVIIEDFPYKDGDILARYVKIWCNHYPFNAEVKGSSITIVPVEFKIVVTSNFSIEQVFHHIEDQRAIWRRFTQVELTRENKPLIMAAKIEDLGQQAGEPQLPELIVMP